MKAGLDGPSKTITVEPSEQPVVPPVEPSYDPAPVEQPEKVPANG